jgi:hypothetical protein
LLKGDIEPQRAKVAIDAIKWRAGRMKPQKYGDSHNIRLGGNSGNPIQVEDRRHSMNIEALNRIIESED